ncbi:hypothetical protein [Rickettsiella massiliensis]|nr:hypothetical protein [Rickettsiella massiliensis]
MKKGGLWGYLLWTCKKGVSFLFLSLMINKSLKKDKLGELNKK